MIVENRPSGIILGEVVAKAPADGHTLLLTGSSFWLAPYMQDNVPWDPVRDFAPITLAASSPNLVVVHPSVPVKSIRELVALAQANPGTLRYASSGNGSAAQLAAELFKSMAKVKLLHVPFKGVGPALTDAIAGHVPVCFCTLPTTLPHVRTARLRALAVTTANRTSAAADIPTVAESGIPGFDVATWESIQAPAGTPVEAINWLNTAIREVVAGNELRQKMINLGFEPDAMKSPAETAQFIRLERQKWAKLVKERNIKAE